MNTNAKSINHYIQDGFIKVCEVEENYGQWLYKNINTGVMYADHRSWIYFIVLNDEIVKIGETGQPLGIKMSDGQPKKGTECRLGRIRNGQETDLFIRKSLSENIANGNTVSIWALKCPIYKSKNKVGGKEIDVDTTVHKKLEYHYLDYFENNTGHKPVLNKGRK